MEALRPYYEQELGALRQQARRLAGRYPQLAAALTAEAGAEPGQEWLLQASAFLNARLAQRLDTCHGAGATALLEMRQPHYLRPLPAASIAQVDWSGAGRNACGGVGRLPRGSELKASSGAVRLRTVGDVDIAPLRIGELRFQPVLDAPRALLLPPDAVSAISLRLDSLAPGADWLPSALTRLRLFPDGEPSLRAALRDSLLLHTVACYVESAGRWQRLPCNALAPAALDQAHLPPTPGEDPACRLLSEYFAYPESFDFCDLDLRAVAAGLASAPCASAEAGRSLHVHWVLRDLRQRPAFRLLHGLAPRHLRLGCTPVINLFAVAAEPLQLAPGASSAPLRPSRTCAASCQVYRVERVDWQHKGAGQVAETSFQASRSPAATGPYWQTEREDAMLAAVEGYTFRLALLDRDRRPLALAGDTPAVQLLCSDGAQAATVAGGQPGGHLVCEAGAGDLPIRLLRRPSAFRPAALDPAAYWEAIAGLTPRPAMLGPEGWPALLSLLRCHVAADDVQGLRLLAGLGALERRPATLWRDGQPWHGLALHLSVDQEVFAERSLHTFAQVLNRFLARYVHTHSFVRLHVRDQASGVELLRCPPCAGRLPLV